MTSDVDDEVPTNVSRHERKVVQQEVAAFNRRAEDRFFDRWIKPVIAWAILAIIIAAIKTWLDVTVLQAAVSRLQLDNATRVSAESLALRDERIRQLEQTVNQLQRSVK